MLYTPRPYRDETDYTRIRTFLRQVTRLNGGIERSWPVARLDYWRWHVVLNCSELDSIEKHIYLWENESGAIGAILNAEGPREAYINIDPRIQSPALELAIIEFAEEKMRFTNEDGSQKLYIWLDEDNKIRKEILQKRGYTPFDSVEHQYYRDLKQPLPPIPQVTGYTIRALGTEEELPARSWASWRAFHPDAPDADYEGWEWYRNIQNCPLYRRDLDIVAQAPDGSIAAFCTLWYDDETGVGYFEPVGTVPEHQKRGLGKAVMLHAMHRLKAMNGKLAAVGGYSEGAKALYHSISGAQPIRSEPWLRVWEKE